MEDAFFGRKIPKRSVPSSQKTKRLIADLATGIKKIPDLFNRLVPRRTIARKTPPQIPAPEKMEFWQKKIFG